MGWVKENMDAISTLEKGVGFGLVSVVRGEDGKLLAAGSREPRELGTTKR